MRPLNWEELERFVENVRGTIYGVLYETLLYTGLRPGEALWTTSKRR
jgi:hypothetical protein